MQLKGQPRIVGDLTSYRSDGNTARRSLTRRRPLASISVRA
jgi:hypothetical protein